MLYPYYSLCTIPETEEKVGTGWLPPMPDMRDYTLDSPKVKEMTKKLGFTSAAKLKAPSAPGKVDLRKWCTDIENQGGLGSCTANAAAGIIEYFEKRAFGQHLEASRLFIYKTTRNLMGVTGDTGAWLRTTMGAMRLFGVPDEPRWPYTDAKPDFDKEPTAFIYALGGNYQALVYFCHDPLGASIAPKNVRDTVKLFLRAGIPSMFGFYGFDSFAYSDVKGGIPYPCPGEKARWGHAIVAVGYDDSKKIKNTWCNKTTTGAFLIRNSWGPGWGDSGYGWLPYAYVENQLALDFWSLLSMEWVDTGQFGL